MPRPTDIPHSEMRPTVDAGSRNIMVSSVELAERERETYRLRNELGLLKARYGGLVKKGERDMMEINQLKAGLASGGLAASFRKLDMKYQKMLKKNNEREDTLQNLKEDLKKSGRELDSVKAALDLKAEEFNANKDLLIEAARGGRQLTARDAAIETLKIEFETSEEENMSLKEELLMLQQQNTDFEQVMDRQQAKLDQVAVELTSLGNSKERLAELLERTSLERDALEEEVGVLRMSAGTLQTTLEKLRDAELYKNVLEAQLEDARGELDKLNQNASPEHHEEQGVLITSLKIAVSGLEKELVNSKGETAAAAERHKTELRRVTEAEADRTEEITMLKKMLKTVQEQLVVRDREEKAWEEVQGENQTLREKLKELEDELVKKNEQIAESTEELEARRAEVSRMNILSSAIKTVSTSVRRLPSTPPSPAHSVSTTTTTAASAFLMATTPTTTRHPLPGVPNTPPNQTSVSFTISEPSPSPVIANKRLSSLHDIAYGQSPSSV